MIAVVAVAVLVLGALIYVSAPLRRADEREGEGIRPEMEAALERKRLALVGILDMEEERDSGKLAEPDYRALRARYEREALEALRELATTGADRDAELEAEIARLKASLVCPECGDIRAGDAPCGTCGAS